MDYGSQNSRTFVKFVITGTTPHLLNADRQKYMFAHLASIELYSAKLTYRL
jgi:hypothetical protein